MNVFSFGNKKLPVTTAIFNLCSAHDCPSRKLGLCQLSDPSKCYARKAERLYPKCLPFRNRQKVYWQSVEAFDFVWRLVGARQNITHLRLNESGDFTTQSDINKAVEIAAILSDMGIKTYCYTARSDLNFSARGHLVVNGSGFMVDNQFTIEHKQARYTCPMDCKTCSVCTKTKGLTISVPMH